MQARRVLSLSAVALATTCTIAMLGACGDDDQTIIYVYLEAGAPDARRDSTPVVGDDDDDDASVVSCNPLAVPKFTFKSGGRYLGKCTDELMNTLYDLCVSEENNIEQCDAAKAQNPDCVGCLFGKVGEETQKPWMVYDDNVIPFPNFGLCMATFKSESLPTECGVAYAQFYTCLNAACVTPCVQTQSPEAFDQCRVAALDNKTCETGAQTALGAKCTAAYAASSPTYGFCTSGKDPATQKDFDDKGYMIAIGRLSCGTDPNPSDAGMDADASDSGDAGDAGDADADTGTPP